jgi:heterodisulfide reductase subunit C
VHFAEWLSEDVGAGVIASKMVKPLWGMRIAVHYGCHLLRPQPAVRWDDPINPTKVEALVTALGATVVDYTTKMQCCGGALDRVGERDSALAFCRRKLADLKGEDVDALVVVCPSCFQQFDLNQAALARANENYDIPVLYLTELIGLTYGHTPEEMGMDMHRIPVQPFLDTWEGHLGDRKAVAEYFNVAELAKCAACGACKDDCPVCKIDSEFQPTEIIAMLSDGRIDEVLADDNLWKCVECYTCNELCHSRFGMAEVFRKLKEISVEQGTGKPQVADAYATFLKTGSLGEPRESARKKLGLAPLPKRGNEAVNELLTCEQKKQEVCDAEL